MSAMASKAQVNDDLIHTMSKKIAQLTKVIYLLNTKSDENDYEIKSIRESNENDIKEVLADAHQKMVEFQRRLTSNSEAQDEKAQLVIDGLKRKHSEEKKKALETLADRLQTRRLEGRKTGERRIPRGWVGPLLHLRATVYGTRSTGPETSPLPTLMPVFDSSVSILLTTTVRTLPGKHL